MKKFEILWELPKCDTDTKWTNAIVKMVPRFSQSQVATNLWLVKKKKKKKNRKNETKCSTGEAV